MLSFTDAMLPIDLVQKGGCKKPIAKKKKRVSSSAPAAGVNTTKILPLRSGNPDKRALSTSPDSRVSHLWHTQKGEIFSEK